jgi:bifunctional ADP-heptose synthase (sugar kinase/adenylyltransferase)
VARNVVTRDGEAPLIGALGAAAAGDLVAGPRIAGDRIEGHFVRFAHDRTTTKALYASGGQQIMHLEEQKIDAICGRLSLKFSRCTACPPADRKSFPPRAAR